MKKVAIEDAIGCALGHDITEVRPHDKVKQRLFKRGHIITETDLDRLRDVGKKSIFIWEDGLDEVHEDDAAITTAPLLAGEHITFDPEPSEGKIRFFADCDGVLKVDVDKIYAINSLEIPSLPTLHTNFPVKKGKQVAAFRIIPLTCEQLVMAQIKAILTTPAIQIHPFLFRKAGVIVTGSEVYEGRIKDGFIPRMEKIMKRYHAEVIASTILPDDKKRISAKIQEFAKTCEIIFVTGGTSVDPDDQTVAALRDAGVFYETKGNPLQPGNNFTVGYKGDVCVCAIPAASLHFQATALDVFLPRLLAGEKLTRTDFFKAGHGGLCHFCKTCHFPVCPFAVAG